MCNIDSKERPQKHSSHKRKATERERGASLPFYTLNQLHPLPPYTRGRERDGKFGKDWEREEARDDESHCKWLLGRKLGKIFRNKAFVIRLDASRIYSMGQIKKEVDSLNDIINVTQKYSRLLVYYEAKLYCCYLLRNNCGLFGRSVTTKTGWESSQTR